LEAIQKDIAYSRKKSENIKEKAGGRMYQKDEKRETRKRRGKMGISFWKI